MYTGHSGGPLSTQMADTIFSGKANMAVPSISPTGSLVQAEPIIPNQTTRRSHLQLIRQTDRSAIAISQAEMLSSYSGE